MAINKNTFLWHDYETFGADARRDRPAQFAALRTDENLNPIDDPVIVYCRPADDMLPHPDACMLTGITPQLTNKRGILESEFARRVRNTMLEPGTCVVGYNSIRFDDEFTRNLLYRNFYDPYEREYSNGNSRWDIIDLARACYALRPEGMEWPVHESGKPSFKLEDLSRANGIEHGDAHDAMSDVRATLGLAVKLRQAQPQLFTYGLSLRNKNQVAKLIDPLAGKPFVHSSARIPAERGCTSLMMPVCKHPLNPKAVLCIDLNKSVQDLLSLPAEQLADRLFTPARDMPEGVERISVKSVASNKVPFVAPMSLLRDADLDRIQLDLDRCLKNAELVAADSSLAAKIESLFGPYEDGAVNDPDLMIYSGGFFDAHDKRLMREVHACRPEQLGEHQFAFNDKRLDEMLFRFRARNFPGTLNNEEAQKWQHFRSQRFFDESGSGGITYESYLAVIQHWREQKDLRSSQYEILDQLDAWPIEIGIPGMISDT